MSLESHEPIAVVAPPKLTRPEPPLERSAADLLPARTPEELKAVEAVFTQHNKEGELAAGLWGMWSGALILHDVLVDTFTEPAGDVEVEPKKKKARE
jgi:hypothetical protein